MAINSLNPLPKKQVLTGQAKAFNDATIASYNSGASRDQSLYAGQTAASGITPVAGAIQPNYVAPTTDDSLATIGSIGSTTNTSRRSGFLGGLIDLAKNMIGSGKPPTAPAAPYVKPQTAYEKLLQERLAGRDPNVINAQNQQNTDTAASRYLAFKTGNQNNENAGFAPGSLQSQRGLDRTQATSEEGILSGQDRVNALARSSGEDAIAASQADDQQNYSRGQTLINSIADVKARQAAAALVAGGMDPNEAYNTVVGANGTVNTGYRSDTPAQVELQGYKDVYMAEHPDATDADATAYAQTQLSNAHDTTTNPNHGAVVTQTLQDIQGKINTGDFAGIDWNSDNAKAALGQAPVINTSTVYAEGSPEQFVSKNAGKLATVGGKPVVIQKYTAYRSGDYHTIRIIQASDPVTNSPVWIDVDTGRSSSTPPPADNVSSLNHKWVNSFT